MNFKARQGRPKKVAAAAKRLCARALRAENASALPPFGLLKRTP